MPTPISESLPAQLLIDAEQPALHRHRGVQSVGRIFRRRCGRAEQRHQTIAEILIERSAVRKNDVRHRGEISIEQADDLFRRRMFGNARETANVGKQYRDRLIDAAELERLGILEHLLHYILGQKPAVVCARYFFTRQTFVRARVLNGDRRLRGDGADQLQIVRLERRKRIQPIGVDARHALCDSATSGAQIVERTPCETIESTPANCSSEAASCESNATRSFITLRVMVRPMVSLRACASVFHRGRAWRSASVSLLRDCSVPVPSASSATTRSAGVERKIMSVALAKIASRSKDRAERLAHLVKRGENVCLALQRFEHLVPAADVATFGALTNAARSHHFVGGDQQLRMAQRLVVVTHIGGAFFRRLLKAQRAGADCDAIAVLQLSARSAARR